MKQILILLFSIISLGSFAQEKINWLTLNQAVKASGKEQKYIFIDVYTEWCGWCKRMDATTFTHPKVIALMNRYFYAVKLDAEQKEDIIVGGKTYKNENPTTRRASHQFAQLLLNRKMSYPTVVMLDKKFNSFGPIPGYQSAKNLEPMLLFIGSEKYKNQKWAEFSKSFVSTIP